MNRKESLRTSDEYYDRKYSTRDEIFRSYHEKILELLNETENNSRVLDVGSGTGLLTGAMKARGHVIIGVDRSLKALKKRKQKSSRNVQANFETNLPFRSSSFSSILCIDVLEHISRPLMFLRECKRILHSNGTLFLAVPNSAQLLYRIQYLLGYVPAELQIPGHRIFFSEDYLVKLIQKAGLKIKQRLGRNLYLALKDEWIPGILKPVLRTFGFHEEYSYSHEDTLWIKTSFSNRFNSLFSDALLLVVKPN